MMEKREEKAKRHRRRMRALRGLILRILSLALVLYVLFFHLVGIMTMPNGDMYPRIDAGDLILFYRLDRSIKSRDIVVIDKVISEEFSVRAESMPGENWEEEQNDASGKEAVEDVTREAAAAEAGQSKAEKSLWRKVLTWLKVPDSEEPAATRFVCRVVAAPGDTVEITDESRLLVNGNSLIETGIFYPTTEYVGFVEYPITLGENEYFVLADKRNGGADSRFFGPVTRDEIQGVVITIMRRNNL